MAKGTWVMRTAVVVSILAHASLIGAAGLRRPAPPPPEPPAPVDVWAGTTALPIGGEELQEVDVVGSSPAETTPAAPPAAPAAPTQDDAVPVEPPKPPPVQPDKPIHKDKPVEKEKPVAPKSPPVQKTVATPKPTPATDIPDKDAPEADKTPEPQEPSSKDKPADDQDKPADEQDKPVAQDKPAPEKPARPTSTSRKPTPAAPAAASSADTPAADAPAKGPSGSFGAEGTASVRDLGRAFTRALPPACDSDATWGKLPAGSAGSLEVAVIIDEEGKINGFEPISKDPPKHLINAMKRTLALLKGGVFALQGGSVTAGRQVLRLSVELSDTTVTEEEASGASAFGLASKWEGKKGVASFTQTSGRHVEISVEFVRVEPRKD